MLKISVCVPCVLLAVVVVSLPLLDEDAYERPGFCRIGDVYIKEGEQGPGPVGRCMRMSCKNSTPGHMEISGVGCATFVPRPGCHMSAYDKTKRYPDCCPQEVCDEDPQDNQLD